MKHILTEKEFSDYISYEIKSILNEVTVPNDKVIRKNFNNVVSHMSSLANSENKEGEELRKRAQLQGINIDSLKGKGDYNNEFNDRVQNITDNKNAEINEWVKKYLPILRNCFKGSNNFRSGVELASRDNTNPNGNTFKRDNYGNIIIKKNKLYFDNLDDETKANVINLRDFLDRLSLRCLYRNATPPLSVKNRFGLDVKTLSPETPVEQIDFSNLSDEDIDSFYNGSRVNRINNQLNLDPSVKIKRNSPHWKNVEEIAKVGKIKQIAELYVSRKYGLNFEMSNGNIDFGNAKISKDTLIINFTSAVRCPAWNECLLKDACYARVGELAHDMSYNNNQRLGLIWESTKTDNVLMELMIRLIRSYLIDYTAAYNEYKEKYNQTINEEEENNIENYTKLTEESFSSLLSKYGQEFIECLKNNRRGKIVRLNENGDFIGQWLVDAWDSWANDFKIVDINVAAYTCRALNYEKISNLILNISQENLVKGMNCNSIAHYFYAIEEETYNRLGETYNGPNYSLLIEKNKIVPVYRGMIDEDGNLVGYYYKCPCGRNKKYSYVPCDKVPNNSLSKVVAVSNMPTNIDKRSPKYISYNGQYYNKKVISKADCYLCRICYARDSDGDVQYDIKNENGQKVPVYVFVAVHGSNKNEFADAGSRRIAGKTAEEWADLQAQQKMSQIPTQKKLKKSNLVSEDIENPDVNVDEENQKFAINQIVKNTIESVANRMSNKGNLLNEEKNFFRLFNKIDKK